jgi:hypothetical protein
MALAGRYRRESGPTHFSARSIAPGDRYQKGRVMRLATRSGLIATSLAIAAIAAPNASAGSGVQATTPTVGGPMSSGPTIVRGISGVQASTPTVGGPMSAGPTVVVRGTAASSGFHYGDAAIGAGVMAGLTLLGAASTLTIRRRIQVEHS